MLAVELETVFLNCLINLIKASETETFHRQGYVVYNFSLSPNA